VKLQTKVVELEKDTVSAVVIAPVLDMASTTGVAMKLAPVMVIAVCTLAEAVVGEMDEIVGNTLPVTV
jgi:hypothetical protein